MRLCKLNDTALSIKGNVPAFLNGLTSNVLEAPLNAFLNQHGRIISTFRMIKMHETEAVIAVPEIALPNLLKHLDRYARLSHATLTSLPQEVYMDLDSKRIVLRDQAESPIISDEEFTLFRLDNNIPLMGIDFKEDEFILNVHEYNYTSYTKGCFLGQEPVAKVHNRAKPTRKLVVAFEDELGTEQQAAMTSKVKDPVSCRSKGFIFVSNTL